MTAPYRTRQPWPVDTVQVTTRTWDGRPGPLRIVTVPVRALAVRCSPGTPRSHRRHGRHWLAVQALDAGGLSLPDDALRRACATAGVSFALSWLASRWRP